jgi:uncharacterized protein (DUF1778 family)
MAMPAALDSRLDVRVNRKLKELIQEAAALTGQTLSDFVISTLTERAHHIVQQERLTVLSDRDRDLFLAMLDADTKPNAALRKAAAWYKKNYGRVAD